MYIKTPPAPKRTTPNRRVISGGKPAERKRSGFFQNRSQTGGSAPQYGRRINNDPPKKKKSLPVFTPWKVILASFLIGVCGILYIGHVFNTQQSLMEVQLLENEFNKAQRLYNEQRLAYDRMVGPKEIYQKAREEGYINAGSADPIIHINP